MGFPLTQDPRLIARGGMGGARCVENCAPVVFDVGDSNHLSLPTSFFCRFAPSLPPRVPFYFFLSTTYITVLFSSFPTPTPSPNYVFFSLTCLFPPFFSCFAGLRSVSVRTLIVITLSCISNLSSSCPARPLSTAPWSAGLWRTLPSRPAAPARRRAASSKVGGWTARPGWRQRWVSCVPPPRQDLWGAEERLSHPLACQRTRGELFVSSPIRAGDVCKDPKGCREAEIQRSGQAAAPAMSPRPFSSTRT